MLDIDFQYKSYVNSLLLYISDGVLGIELIKFATLKNAAFILDVLGNTQALADDLSGKGTILESHTPVSETFGDYISDLTSNFDLFFEIR